MQEGKVVVWRGLTNIRGKMRRERQGRKGKIYPTECKAPENRRDKEAFFNEQWKEIEENNRIGKTKELFKKTGAIKGIFHARMGTIKDKNSKELKQAEAIKKSGKNTQKNYTKKVLMIWITTMVWSFHSESGILECEVKWTLWSTAVNKASGDDGIQAGLFKFLKDNATRVLYSIC